MDTELSTLITNAKKAYSSHFPPAVTFERAIFFSWGCAIGDCGFCYMSTQPKEKLPKETKRSIESILAEFVLAKQLGWDIGFFTGGIGVLSPDEIELILKTAVEITGEKIWLSVGPVPKVLLQRYLPYIKGVVGSTETINPELHRKVCPSKPLAPYERMFTWAKELGLSRAMTFIVGMGETHDDFPLLTTFIRTYGISKIHIYGLIPQQGTMFEKALTPSAQDQAWWIAKLRVEFPTLDIQAGIWDDRSERIPILLDAGANSLSKFQATKYFGTKIAADIEHQCTSTGRIFKGTLTKLPVVDWTAQADTLSVDFELKEKIKKCLLRYVEQMRKNTQTYTP